MTRTRLLAALIMTPLAIAAVLLLPTPWLLALTAVVFLAALWEWFRLAEIDDTLQRTVLLVANLALMVALVWAQTRGGTDLPLFRLAVVAGVVWWLLSMLWLKQAHFASDHDTHARAFKLAAGTLAVRPGLRAPVPELDPRPILTMSDMGHGGMGHDAHGTGGGGRHRVPQSAGPAW